MKCPSCGVSFSIPPPECPYCGLTVAQLNRKFGLVPYYSRYVSDRSERLSRRELEKLREYLRLFERRFPQVVFCVLLINLGPHVSISEYAFWLANRARFSGAAAIGPKNFELLLIIDPLGGAAAMIAGYGLETYLTEQDLQEALDSASVALRASELSLGIREITEFTMGRLREIALRLEETAATHQPVVMRESPDTQ